MFIPWDFGIINAIKKELGEAIFPPSPPRELRNTPYLMLELKNIMHGKNLVSRVEFAITIVDNENISSKSVNIMKSIGKIISKELTLYQGNGIIGSARIKSNGLESRKNLLILNMVAMLKLKAIYDEDGENDNDEENDHDGEDDD